MSHTVKMPPTVSPGDRVAIVSPSFAAPALFPQIHEQSMRRLVEELDLEPVEYPTTREVGASPADRARDLMAAFADPTIACVMATIGGDDQITVLPHLDPAVFLANPKPYFGYSDNTNLLNWLWNLGLGSFHGGSTMVHLGRGGGLHPVTLASLRHALFDDGPWVIPEVSEFSEDEVSWDDPAALARSGPVQASGGWEWHQADRVVTGTTWGGNLEILHWNLAAGRWIRPAEDYTGCVLMLETSEEMPSGTEVYRMLRNMGERGLLEVFPAVIVGRPKASALGALRDPEERASYREEQREAVLRALREYNPDAMAVFGVDLGHTDPQVVVPYGGRVVVDGAQRRLIITPNGSPVRH